MLSTSPLDASNYRPVALDSTSGDDSQKLAFLLQMADRFESDGNIAEAVKSAETALLFRKALPNAATALGEPIHRQAISVIQKCNGAAVVEFQANRYDSALFLLNKALFLSSSAADTNCFGMHEHDRLRLRAATLNNLGCLEKRRNNINESLNYLQGAVEIETLVDPDVGASPSTSLNLCTLFNKTGRHEDAVAAAHRAINTLHFQAQQGQDNIPQFVNMLMVAHYNLGVSVECAGAAGSLSKAMEAYSRTLDIHREHGRGVPSTTADAASEALRRLRASQVSYPVAAPPVSQETRQLHTASRQSSAPTPKLPTTTLPEIARQQMLPRALDSTATFSIRAPTRPDTVPQPPSSARFAGASGRRQPMTPGQLQGDPPASERLLESAAALGNAALRHAARIQTKNRRREEASERASAAVAKAQKAHRRDKEVKRRKELEAEAHRRDEIAQGLYERMVESMRAEEIKRSNIAACRIAAVWRGFITRKFIELLTQSAITIQALVRSGLCRLKIRQSREEAQRKRLDDAITLKRTTAAMILQKHLRLFLRRLSIIRRFRAKRLREYHSARRIQRAFRNYRGRLEEAVILQLERERIERETEMGRLHIAASKIQGMFRSFKSRRFARVVRQEQQRRTRAAILIQAMLRGCLTRQWFKHYRLFRREQEMSSALSIRSICRIQRAWRCAISRSLLKRRRDETIIAQRNKLFNASALRIQCAYRCHRAREVARPLRKEAMRRVQSATTIQCSYRCHKAREMTEYLRRLRRVANAAFTLQRWIRRVRERRAQHAHFQKQQDKRQREREALRRTAAAMCIQSYCLSAISRRSFVKAAQRHVFLTTHALAIQRAGRSHLAAIDMKKLKDITAIVLRKEEDYVRMSRAARVIQRKTREYLAKNAVMEKRRHRAAAIAIQCAWRSFRARSKRNELVKLRNDKRAVSAASTIQRVGRGYLRHLELKRLEEFYLQRHREKMRKLRREEAATHIQAVWKGSATRTAVTAAKKRFLHRTLDAIRIQRAWRSFHFRKSLGDALRRRILYRRGRNEAATKAQSFWRMVLAKEYVSLVRERHFQRSVSAISLQCAWRCCKARQELQRRKTKRIEHQQLLTVQHDGWLHAIDVVNMFARTLLDGRLRLQLKERWLGERVHQKDRARFQRRHMAASKIQAHYRGYYERVYCRGLRREHAEREAKQRAIRENQTRAALKIQCAVRSMFARRRANIVRVEQRIQKDRATVEAAAAAAPQDVVKRLFWQHEALLQSNLSDDRLKRLRKREMAATKIQSIARMCAGKKRAAAIRERNRHLALVAQEMASAEERRQKHDIEWQQISTMAATRIQSVARMFLVRKAWRGKVSSEVPPPYVDLDRAAIKIQSVWRGHVARVEADRLALERDRMRDATTYFEAARAIQKWYRGHLVRRSMGVSGSVARYRVHSRPVSSSPAFVARNPSSQVSRAPLPARPAPGIY